MRMVRLSTDILGMLVCWMFLSSVAFQGNDLRRDVEDAFNSPLYCKSHKTVDPHACASSAAAQWSPFSLGMHRTERRKFPSRYEKNLTAHVGLRSVLVSAGMIRSPRLQLSLSWNSVISLLIGAPLSLVYHLWPRLYIAFVNSISWLNKPKPGYQNRNLLVPRTDPSLYRLSVKGSSAEIAQCPSLSKWTIRYLSYP